MIEADDHPSWNHTLFITHEDLQRLCGKIANVNDATRRKKSLGTLDRISPRNCRSLASFCVNVTL